jgi:hypothetical protein
LISAHEDVDWDENTLASAAQDRSSAGGIPWRAREVTIMLGNHSLSGLMKWLSHEEWREPFAETLDLHVGPACDDYDMDFEDMAEVIGDHWATTL